MASIHREAGPRAGSTTVTSEGGAKPRRSTCPTPIRFFPRVYPAGSLRLRRDARRPRRRMDQRMGVTSREGDVCLRALSYSRRPIARTAAPATAAARRRSLSRTRRREPRTQTTLRADKRRNDRDRRAARLAEPRRAGCRHGAIKRGGAGHARPRCGYAGINPVHRSRIVYPRSLQAAWKRRRRKKEAAAGPLVTVDQVDLRSTVAANANND